MVIDIPLWYAVGLADNDCRRDVGLLVESQRIIVIYGQFM